MTRVIGALETSGSLKRARGVLTVADRRKLESQSCECYETLRRHFEQVLPGVYPTL